MSIQISSGLESSATVLLSFLKEIVNDWPFYFSFVIIIFSFYLFAKITAALAKVLLKTHMQESILDLILDSYRLLLVIVGIIVGLSHLGVNVTAGIAGLGIVGIAVGFAAKDTLANIISGVTLFWDKPFCVGDWIRLREFEGQVVQITLRSTRIRTRKNEYIVVPNQEIANQTVVNLSKQGEIRIDIPFCVGYNESMDKVRKVLSTIHKDDARLSTMRDFPFEIVVDEPGDFGIKCLYRVWVSDFSHQQRVFLEYNERIIKGLQAAAIEIPYPSVRLLPNAKKPKSR